MATCKCTCQLGFSGDNCQNFVLIQWESVATAAVAATTSLLEVQSRRLLTETTAAAPVRTARFSWSMSDWAVGSTFERYDALGMAIAGSSITLTSNRGGVLVALTEAKTSPNLWKYSLKLSRGLNEWGKSRGYVTTDITEKVSPLEYDAANSCYQGGFRPRDDAPVSKAKQLCSTAYANQNNSGTYPPVPMQTLAPTMPSLLPIGKKEINEATAKVAEWVSTNIGGTASAFGKAFPVCIKSSQDLSSSQMIGSALQSLILGSATALVPTRVPTIQPSLAPSITPSLVPTSVNKYNSLQPSIVPTAQPTRVPTLSPSIAPTAVPSLLPGSSNNSGSGFDFMECKNHVFQSTDEPVCRLILGYGTYLLVGSAVGILILLIGSVWLMMRKCCGLCGGNKPQGPYSPTDKIVLYVFYGLFTLLILLGGAGGFAMVSMLPTRINATADAIDYGTLHMALTRHFRLDE